MRASQIVFAGQPSSRRNRQARSLHRRHRRPGFLLLVLTSLRPREKRDRSYKYGHCDKSSSKQRHSSPASLRRVLASEQSRKQQKSPVPRSVHPSNGASNFSRFRLNHAGGAKQRQQNTL